MPPPLSIRFLRACALAVMMCSIGAVHGRTIQLNWTSDGVRDYTSTPLNIELGDILELICSDNNSNLFIQTDRIQYDSCNASAGSGAFDYNGLCFPGNPIMLTFKENSQDLTNTVNFMDNQAYFLTSYSEGRLRGSDDTFTSGGQCEDGLKMIITIGEVEVPTVGSKGPGDNAHGTDDSMSPNRQGLGKKSGTTANGVPLYIIGAAAGGGALLMVGLCIMVIVIIVCVKKGCCSWETKTKSSMSYGNSSTAAYFNESLYNNCPDSQACTLTRADFNQGSKPVTEIQVQETTQQNNDNAANLQTFGVKKSLGSVDCLHDNPSYKSLARNFDDATGQLSTPFHANTTPEHLLKAKSTSELSSAPTSTHPTVKPKPLPPPKRRQNNVYKSSSADNLIS